MGIQDNNTKNSITSRNYPKSETLRKQTLIDWHIVIKPSEPCSGRKSTSEKISVDSYQNWPPQLTLKLSVVRLARPCSHPADRPAEELYLLSP